MKTPKEEAKNLIESFINLNFEHAINSNEQYGMSDEYHKKCAIFCVNKILDLDFFSLEGREYWEEVKKELELL